MVLLVQKVESTGQAVGLHGNEGDAEQQAEDGADREVAILDTGDEDDSDGSDDQDHGSTQVGYRNGERHDRDRDGDRPQGMSAVHNSEPAAQEEGEEESERRLCQFGRLQGKRTGLEPAVISAVGEVDGDQQKQNHSQTGEGDLGIIPRAVIALHEIEQDQDGDGSPTELAKEEVGGRDVILQLRDKGGGAVDHDEPEAHESEYGEEQDPVCFEPLSH